MNLNKNIVCIFDLQTHLSIYLFILYPVISFYQNYRHHTNDNKDSDTQEKLLEIIVTTLSKKQTNKHWR